jgi:deoxycytidine triphosphate deaminase
MKIGQMIFYQMAGIPQRSYAITGRYNGDTSAQQSKD